MTAAKPRQTSGKRRGRRPAEPGGGPKRSETTRAQIIAAAIEEFAARGFHEAKVSEIVARAGVTQPSFYFYFPSKQAIYDHLLERAHDELMARIRADRARPDVDGTSVPDMARAASEAFLKYFAENTSLANIGYFQSPISASIRDEVIAALARQVAYEQGAGYLRRELDPEFVSECYGGILERLIQRYLFTGRMTAEELARNVMDVFLNGILGPDHRAVADSKQRPLKR